MPHACIEMDSQQARDARRHSFAAKCTRCRRSLSRRLCVWLSRTALVHILFKTVRLHFKNVLVVGVLRNRRVAALSSGGNAKTTTYGCTPATRTMATGGEANADSNDVPAQDVRPGDVVLASYGKRREHQSIMLHAYPSRSSTLSCCLVCYASSRESPSVFPESSRICCCPSITQNCGPQS